MAKQRQQRMSYQQGSLGAMQQLESRSDEQLMSESRHRAAARAILGARAAERYDPKEARRFFNEAMAGAHPQERPALRQMMKASMALAERKPDELRDAVAKLGQAPPSNRQLLMLRFMGLVAPTSGAGVLARVRGILILLGIVVALLAVGYGLAELMFLPFGGIGFLAGLLVAMVIVVAALGILALVGRRRQSKAKEAARAARP
ncbi:MAG: hypothetical protein ACR2NV_01800 [Thermoleophilaceae bacterium]